jgi:hypothetical protein
MDVVLHYCMGCLYICNIAIAELKVLASRIPLPPPQPPLSFSPTQSHRHHRLLYPALVKDEWQVCASVWRKQAKNHRSDLHHTLYHRIPERKRRKISSAAFGGISCSTSVNRCRCHLPQPMHPAHHPVQPHPVVQAQPASHAAVALARLPPLVVR